MITWTFIIAAAVSIINTLEVYAIYPNYCGLLFHVEIEHRPRNRTYKSSISTAIFPPLLGKSTVIEQYFWLRVCWVGISRLDIDNIDIFIELVIKIKRGNALILKLLVNSSKSLLWVDRAVGIKCKINYWSQFIDFLRNRSHCVASYSNQENGW